MGRFWASKDRYIEDMMQSEHRKKRLEIEKPVSRSFPGQGNSLGLIVFDDPAVSDRVERILHPERFRERKTSVLKRLNAKKGEVRKIIRKDEAKEKSKEILQI